MTRDKIKQLAKEAGLPLAYISVNGVLNWGDLERFAALVVEECAKVCEKVGNHNITAACAAAIRARKP